MPVEEAALQDARARGGEACAADAAGSPGVYWLTQQDNLTAQQLYDRIATKTDFIKYQRPAA